MFRRDTIHAAMSVTALSSSLFAATPSAGTGSRSAAPGTSSQSLSADDETLLRTLQARDREVRQHEQAHLAASGGLALSGARFSYQRGPDGVDYAVGGEVSIDTSPGGTPEETLQRARQLRAAALAPAQPSGQDLAVAAQAARMAMDAQDELARSATEDRAAGSDQADIDSRAADAALALYAGNDRPEGSSLRITDTYA